MIPKAETIRQFKADALAAGATGVLIIREMRATQITFQTEYEGKPATLNLDGLMLNLDGPMILVAVFAETDGGPAGIES